MADESTDVIGRGISIRGNLSGAEDLVIEGKLEGRISIDNHLTIEENGVVQAEIEAKTLTIKGTVRGNIVAGDRVAVLATARVTGDIRAPRVMIEDGGSFKGHIDMDVSAETPVPRDAP